MIDPATEELLTIREAAKLPQFRRNGKAAHFSTLFRWMQNGTLDSVMVGGLRLTSTQAVQRMLAKQNPGVVPKVSHHQREREINAAEKRLAMAGV